MSGYRHIHRGETHVFDDLKTLRMADLEAPQPVVARV